MFDHLGRFLIHQPFGLVLLVFDIAVGGMNRQRFTALPLGLVYRAYLPAGVLGEKFIEPVFDTCHIIVHAVWVDGVKVVVDSDMPYSMLGEGEVDVQSREG